MPKTTRDLTPAESMLRFATQYLGLQEKRGGEDNEVILQMFKDIGHSWVKHDETAWCSCFINWVAQHCKCDNSGKLNARSWLYVGTGTDDPRHGDIVVFWRESPDSWKGHVGLFMGYSKEGNIFVLGGNQGNEVCIKTYPIDMLLSFRKLKYEAV